MASSSSGGGEGRSHPSASSSTPSLPSPSPSPSPLPLPASLDGGLLLRLLQNSPAHRRSQIPSAQQFFVDPTVAAVGSLFPTQAQMQGGSLAWPSAAQPPSPQQQIRFPDPNRLAPAADPYAALGGGGFGAADAVKAERPRRGAPPPGFGKVLHPAAVGCEAPNANAFGGVRNREPNQGRPGGFGRASNKEVETSEADQNAFGILSRNLHGEHHMPINNGRDASARILYSEQQQRDHLLSRTPPDMNRNRPFSRMHCGEQQTHTRIGSRTLGGDQQMPLTTGGRILHKVQGHHKPPYVANTPQREQMWQGHMNEKGHASHKLPTANACDILGKTPVKELHHVTVPSGNSVPEYFREDRVNCLGNGRVGEVGLEHGIDGGELVADTMKSEVSYQESEVRFARQDEEEGDGGREEDVMVEQLTDGLVINDSGEAKGVVLQKGSIRNKDFRSDFSRGHYVSSQRIRFQRRNRPCRYDIDQFTPSFLSIFESLVPSKEEIAKQHQLLTTLSRIINKEWPNSRLYLYGSCANSFGFSNSDIDLCLSIDDKEMSKVDVILKLADILEAGNLQDIQALTRARVPIVKLMDPETGLSCDICVNNLLAVVNTKLLKDYAQIDRRLRQLAFIVKHWAKSRRVNETYQGTLSSYAYVIMCIHLLQLHRILPCLQEMEPTYYVTVEENHCAYFDRVDKLNNYGARNKDTVSRLLWAFFHYWAYEHDYTSDVISIRTGRIISKERKHWTRRVGNDRHLICIEDPFETSHDLGRVVDKFSIKILREEFERAADILQFDPNPSVTLFEPYVPPPPLRSLIHDERAAEVML